MVATGLRDASPPFSIHARQETIMAIPPPESCLFSAARRLEMFKFDLGLEAGAVQRCIYNIKIEKLPAPPPVFIFTRRTPPPVDQHLRALVRVLHNI